MGVWLFSSSIFEVVNDELRVNMGAQITPVFFISDVQIKNTYEKIICIKQVILNLKSIAIDL